jgi:hypothetical protein
METVLGTGTGRRIGGWNKGLGLAVVAILVQLLVSPAFSQSNLFSATEYPGTNPYTAPSSVPDDRAATDALFRICREAIYAVYYQIPPKELDIPAKYLAKRSGTGIEPTTPILSGCRPIDVRGDQFKIRCDGWLTLVDFGELGTGAIPVTWEIVIDFGGSLRPVAATGNESRPRLVQFREASLDELAEEVQRQDAEKLEESFRELMQQRNQDQGERRRAEVAVTRV